MNWQKYPVPVRQVVDLTRSVAVALSGQALHAQEVGAVVDADVVGTSFSPGLEDAEAALGGAGHEAEFDPLSALLEAGELFPVIHGLAACPETQKGAACVAAPCLSLSSNLYIHYITLRRVFGTFLEIYLLNVLNELCAMEGCGGLDRISSGSDLSLFRVGERAQENFRDPIFLRHRKPGRAAGFRDVQHARPVG